MSIGNHKNYLIIDVEATCCHDDAFPTTEMEMIEIGAVMVCGETLDKLSEFCTFIKPVRHPNLTQFCTELTTITQEDVDAAPNYQEAIKQLKVWLYQFEDFLFCSWGDYDKAQFMQDCGLHKVPYPIPAPHLNIKKQFSKAQRVRKRQGMNDALKLAGIPLEGTHHRGIDDANNMVKLMPFVLGRKFISRQK
ncbi:3'-5' exonuclease [Litorilituus lipolyticus]|uniref:Exonuclease domain-containing protein n=1 Tax=Litorilituus lipolyticus TaxID=2491017 RepID=A0A502KVV8_9GAMM|nr:3'-5' exonuclease [Litorilituus lipolyticus]TPH15752.1 exonuclease domain-containing protein [Litorilituus lipolyticus]